MPTRFILCTDGLYKDQAEKPSVGDSVIHNIHDKCCVLCKENSKKKIREFEQAWDMGLPF